MPVLVAGATGATGIWVVRKLLADGEEVRAVVRQKARLPDDVAGNPKCRVIETPSFLSLSDADLTNHLRGCTAVVSCLGHVGVTGIFGPPFRLVTDSAARISNSIERLQPASPVRFVMMGTVGVANPSGGDPPKGWLERFVIASLAFLIPAFADSAKCAEYFAGDLNRNRHVEWCVVRPGGLHNDDNPPEYQTFETLQSSLFDAGVTARSNVGRFMADLATSPGLWAQWKGKFPVILDKTRPANSAESKKEK
eukprot:TRINITY_DN1436_c0_g1_i7.p3 TRINITY_DN1436_c0_g1~~TRINITY_DN1436_c0_g1_i7.p3  ORF type:complete len:252 (+),score=80.26 TRINITY_DN1436_c0_g1_i7:197-952(+)